MNENELQAFKVGFCKQAAELGITPSELLRYKVAYTGMVPEPMEAGDGTPYSGPGLDLRGPARVVGRVFDEFNRSNQTPGRGFYGPAGFRPGSPFTQENPYNKAINDPNTFGQLANSYPRMNHMIPGAGVFNGGMNLASLGGALRTSIEARSDRNRAQQAERDRLAPGLQAYEQGMNSRVATPATVQFGPERDARIAAQTAAREARDRQAANMGIAPFRPSTAQQAPTQNNSQAVQGAMLGAGMGRVAGQAGQFGKQVTPATIKFGPERDARIAAQTAAREARDRAAQQAQAPAPNLPYADRAGGFNSPPAPAAPPAAPQMTPEIRAGMNAAADVMGNLPGGGLASMAMRGAAGTPYFLARQPGGPGDEAMSPAVTARRAENAKLKSDLGLDIGSTPNQKVGSLQDIGGSAIKTLLLAVSAGTLAGGAGGALANYLYNKGKDVVDPEQSMLPEFSEAEEAKKLHLIARYRNAANEVRKGLA